MSKPTAMVLLQNLQTEIDEAVRDFDLEDFAKFGAIGVYNANISGVPKWHIGFTIGAGEAAIKWEHWDQSVDKCIEHLNIKLRKFFAGEE